jgi:omega-6 fatty acid desaturase (delta-12 desaturase)
MTSPTKAWRDIVARYQTPSVRRAVWQLINSIGPLLAAFAVMYWSLGVSYWLTLLLALPTAGFAMRTFIIMHDCGHGSFLPSRLWNDIVGWVTGILTATPYSHWRREHAIHHATSGHLEGRGTGDINTLTVREYLALGRWGRLRYRLYRNPVVLLGFGPAWLFLKHRWPTKRVAGNREIVNVIGTNLALAGVVIIFSFLIGSVGVWLFYVQHQFEDTYWRAGGEWDYATAAVMGSSYFRLPRVFQWFTGNIGFHHVHHLSPRIPNYQLERCHRENPEFQRVTTLTILEGIRTMRLKLWDEESGRLVGFGHLRRYFNRRRG